MILVATLFVWYDSYLKRFVDLDTACSRANLSRKYAEDLQIGVFYVSEGIVSQLISSQDVEIEVHLFPSGTICTYVLCTYYIYLAG